MTAYINPADGSLVVVLPDLRDLDQENRPWRSPPCHRCDDGTEADWRVIADPGRLDEQLCTPCAQQVLNRRLGRPGQVAAVPRSALAYTEGHQLDWSAGYRS